MKSLYEFPLHAHEWKAMDPGVRCASTASAETTLPASSHAPALARAFVQSHLCPDHGDAAEAAVMLLASELVTHAVLRRVESVNLTLCCRSSLMQVSVSHAGAQDGAEDERSPQVGLVLVDKVARECGRERREDGETLWCTVPTGVVPGHHRVGGQGSP